MKIQIKKIYKITVIIILFFIALNFVPVKFALNLKNNKNNRVIKNCLTNTGKYAIILFVLRPVGQAVKTPPSHGGDKGSIPLRVTSRDKHFYNMVIMMFVFFYVYIIILCIKCEFSLTLIDKEG